jgi:hypothetical protein
MEQVGVRFMLKTHASHTCDAARRLTLSTHIDILYESHIDNR